MRSGSSARVRESLFVCVEQTPGVFGRAEEVGGLLPARVLVGRHENRSAVVRDDLNGMVTGGDAVDERYEIDKANAIVVKAYKGNELVRTLTIGKASSTGSQSYVTLDDKKDIYLVSGTLRDTFKKDVAALRSKSVYTVDSSDLTAVSESMGSTVLSIVKSGDPAAWTASGGAASVDAEKAASWAASLATLNADSWLDDDFVLPPVSESVTVITAGGKAITVSVYKEGDGEEVKYYGTCSETPYKFSLSRYSAGKYLKTAADISAKQ